MSWMVTERYSDVASCPTLGRWAARPSLARTTVAWRGLGPRDQEKRTRHAPLGGYVRVLVDYTAVTCTAAAISHKIEHKTPRWVGSGAFATSPCRQTRDSWSWLVRLDPTRRAAHPSRLFAAPNLINSSWSRRLLESLRTQ